MQGDKKILKHKAVQQLFDQYKDNLKPQARRRAVAQFTSQLGKGIEVKVKNMQGVFYVIFPDAHNQIVHLSTRSDNLDRPNDPKAKGPTVRYSQIEKINRKPLTFKRALKDALHKLLKNNKQKLSAYIDNNLEDQVKRFDEQSRVVNVLRTTLQESAFQPQKQVEEYFDDSFAVEQIKDTVIVHGQTGDKLATFKLQVPEMIEYDNLLDVKGRETVPQFGEYAPVRFTMINNIDQQQFSQIISNLHDFVVDSGVTGLVSTMYDINSGKSNRLSEAETLWETIVGDNDSVSKVQYKVDNEHVATDYVVTEASVELNEIKLGDQPGSPGVYTRRGSWASGVPGERGVADRKPPGEASGGRLSALEW